MTTALLELPYLPNAVWLKNYLKHDAIFVEREENFVKSSHRNRCEIAGANGKQQLSIPLAGGRDHHQLYKTVRIDNTKLWQKIHWQSIISAYGSTPFFEYYADRFQPFYEKQYDVLFDFNYEILQTVLKAIKAEKPFELTAMFEKEPEGKIDYRKKQHADLQTPDSSFSRYCQPFEERHGFMENLCALDLIFNLGPQTKDYLLGQKE